MRFVLAILLTNVFASALTHDADAQVDEAARLLDEGNSHFREGDFDEARMAYEEVLALGMESGAVYYNLGNAYFRMDKLGKAMLNYRRASRFFPDDAALSHNMDLVRSRARDQLSVLPQPVFSKWWNTLVDAIGLRTLFWSGVVAWLAGLALVARRVVTGSLGAMARRAAATLLLGGLLAGAGAVASSVARADNVSAVVITDRAHVLEGPANDARTVVVIHEGLVVDVLVDQERWIQVRLPNGVTGFVERETIETI
jgi:tetratricopeptide (TPR) repeat protein